MASQVTDQYNHSNVSEIKPFLLQFQEQAGTTTPTGEITAIQAGTRTITEASKEHSDADPTTRNYMAIKRKRRK